MKFTPPLSIRSAVLLFPIVMVVALAGFWVAFEDLAQFQRSFTHHVADEDMPSLERLADINGDFQVIEREIYIFLLDAPDLDVEQIYVKGQALLDRLDRNWAMFNDEFSKHQHHSTDTIDQLHIKTESAAQALRAALVEVTQLASVDPVHAQKLSAGVSSAAGTFTQCLNDQTQAIRQRIGQEVTSRTGALETQIQSTVYKLIIFGAFMSLFVIALIAVVRMNLKKIYHYLRTLADEQFGEQDLPAIHDRDFHPLRDVAQTLSKTHNQLREANKALARERDNLDKRVQERTHELETMNTSLGQEVIQRRIAETNAKLYQTVVEQTDEAVIITDERNCIVEVNDAYLRTTGYDRDEVIGKNPRLIRSGHHDEEYYQELWRSLEKTGRWSGEIWDRRKNGEVYPTWLSINVVTDENGAVQNYVGIFIDITEQKKNQRQLEQLAFRDPLTGVANRTLFQDRLTHELDLGERQDWQVALLYIDLDHFKNINDTFGHNVGDDLLILVSQRIQETMRKSDTVARMGGDEFAVILPGHSSKAQIATLAERVVKLLESPYKIDGEEMRIGASIGIAMYPLDADDYDGLTEAADKAMYHAKRSGRGTFAFYGDLAN